MDDRVFQYLVLHPSCRKNVGVAASQAAHAAAEGLRGPVPPHTNVCVLMAKTSDELVSLHLRIKAAGFHSALICEPDPPYDGAPTAVGIEPLPRHQIQHLVVNDQGERFPLLTGA